MRITCAVNNTLYSAIDGIDGEGRIEAMYTKGIKKKSSKSFNSGLSDDFLLSLSEGYQHHCTLNNIHKNRWKVYLNLFNDSMLDVWTYDTRSKHSVLRYNIFAGMFILFCCIVVIYKLGCKVTNIIENQ